MNASWNLAVVSDKGSTSSNDDSYCITALPGGIRVGVFDGTGTVAKKGKLTGGDAAIAASEVASVAPLDMSPSAILGIVNARIREVNRSAGNDLADPVTLAGAVGAIVTVDAATREIEYALVGDVTVIVGYALNQYKSVSGSEFRKFCRRTYLAMAEARRNGILEPDEQIEWARSQLIDNRRMANAADGHGHGILNGMISVAQYEKVGRLHRADGEFMAIVTDGMLAPALAIDSQEDLEADINIIRDRGLQSLLESTRAIENSDPLLFRPRTKVHDDATGVIIRF